MKSSLQSPLKWALGIDDVIFWKILVFSGAVSLFLACLTLPAPVRKILVIGASVTSATAKITTLATKATMERRGTELALLTEASYESFARGVSPSRNEFYESMRPIDDSLVAPFNLLELPWHDNDRIPHFWLLLPTGGGKTTTMTAIVNELPGDIIVCDPHSKRDQWGDLPIVGDAKHRWQIPRLFEVIIAEMQNRYERRYDGDEDYPALNIIIDEFPIVKNTMPPDTFKAALASILMEARKVKIRIGICTQGKSIKTTGLEGQSEVLENLVWLRGGSFAEDHIKSLKNEQLWAWAQRQERLWTFNNFGLDVGDLSGVCINPRDAIHPSTIELLAMIRAESDHQTSPKPSMGTKGISKPMPPGINLVKSPEEPKKVDEISLDIIESKILKYCYKRGECTVGDVQKNNSIGGKFNLNAKTILSIFEALSQRGDVALEANKSVSYTKIIARNKMRDAR